MMYGKLLALTVAGALVASGAGLLAKGFEDLQDRASCAQLELSLALGEPVSPADKAKCQRYLTKRKASAPGGKAKKRAAQEVFADIPDSAFQQMGAKEPVTATPSWVHGKPASGDVIYGVGSAKKGEIAPARQRILAMKRALVEIGAQLEVRLVTSLASQDGEYAAIVRRGKAGPESLERAFQSITEISRMLVSTYVDQARLQEVYQAPEGTLYVLMSLDLARLRQKEDAIFSSVMEMLARAADKAARALGEDDFKQEVLEWVLGVLAQVRAVERSPIGRRLKARWRQQKEGLLRLARRLALCLEVHSPSYDGKRLGFSVTCKGRKVRNARLVAEASGGFLGLPEVIHSDNEGRTDFEVGRSYGRNQVVIHVAYDLADVPGARMLGRLRRSDQSTFRIEALEEPTAVLRVQAVDLNRRGKYELAQAVAKWTEKKWGVRFVGSKNAALVVTANLSIGPEARVMGKVSMPVQLSVSVRGPSGVLFEKTARHAGLAGSVKEAKEQAFRRILGTLSRW